ncbi:hypothetical protein H8356DRAFT_556368 [Neocallimastix lanati (nom. inval.)]|nr:hypothetical protein H8356DRAFT_556368 [Neocallimastix sp. JGI-2020a]
MCNTKKKQKIINNLISLQFFFKYIYIYIYIYIFFFFFFFFLVNYNFFLKELLIFWFLEIVNLFYRRKILNNKKILKLFKKSIYHNIKQIFFPLLNILF